MKGINKKGFTLVELLAVITILGIIMVFAIPNVSNLIGRSRRDNRESNEKTLLMAGKSYMQANTSELPKAIGSKKDIDADVLKSGGYLKEDLTDGNKQNCMEKSYVTVIKSDNNKYLYSAKLICGTENKEKANDENKPTIIIHFYDYNGNELDEKDLQTNKMIVNKVKIEYVGKEDYRLLGYTYSILSGSGTISNVNEINADDGKEKDNSDYTQVTSGSKKLNKVLTAETQMINLTDYIDVANTYHLRIFATAYNAKNIYGEGYRTVNVNDPDAPTCGSIEVFTYNTKTGKYDIKEKYNKKYNQADDFTIDEDLSWIKSGSRQLVVECVDNSGVGCQKEKYTYTFSKSGNNDDEVNSYGRGKITVRNNKGRTGYCYVPVNLDTIKPDPPAIDMRKWKDDEPKNHSAAQNLEKYKNDTWTTFNIYTEPSSKDNVGIKYYQYKASGATKADVTKGDYLNITEEKISNVFWRACDRAKNCSEFTKGTVKIDRSKPHQPTSKDRKLFKCVDKNRCPANDEGLVEYISGTWYNKNVLVKFDYQVGDGKAGVATFGYQFDGGNSYTTENKYLCVENEGSFKLNWWVVNEAGTSSSRTVDASPTIKIDKTAPVITTLEATSTNSKYHTTTVDVKLGGMDTAGASEYSGFGDATEKTKGKACVQTSSDISSCDWVDFTGTKTFKNLEIAQKLDGKTAYIYAWVKDRAGNVSESSVVSYVVYKECSSTKNNGSSYCGSYGSCQSNRLQYATRYQPKKDSYTGKSCGETSTANDCTKSCTLPCDSSRLVNDGSTYCGNDWSACSNGKQYATKYQPRKDSETGESCTPKATTNGCNRSCESECMGSRVVNDGAATCGTYGSCQSDGYKYATKTQNTKDSQTGKSCSPITEPKGCKKSCGVECGGSRVINDGAATCGSYGACSGGKQYATKTQRTKDSITGRSCDPIVTQNGCVSNCSVCNEGDTSGCATWYLCKAGNTIIHESKWDTSKAKSVLKCSKIATGEGNDLYRSKGTSVKVISQNDYSHPNGKGGYVNLHKVYYNGGIYFVRDGCLSISSSYSCNNTECPG